MIPDEVVERVRESADIVQIIGEYVTLKRAGTDFRGPCPFHQGTHRNFSVSPARNMYYCFVCGEGGDIFTFLRKRLGIEWPEAVRMVAGRTGIEIPERISSRDGVTDSREPVWELNATAAEYFTKMLWQDESGAAARSYLDKRGLDRETSTRFALGYAPRDPEMLRSYMKTLGFEEKRLLEAGLVVQREDATLRPRFIDRLMFPIHDASGHCVGFGGRLLRDGEPKYLNSADSPVFSKGKLLYGLHWARNSIRRQNRAIIVEGYFDALRLILAGFDNVVAPLGTALTSDQASLLSRYSRDVVLLYDSDTAGLKATFRAGDILLAQGFSVQVITLPKGEDPDTFVASHGRDALDKQISEAMDILERKLQLLQQKGWFVDVSGRRRAIDRLLPTIRAAVDPLMREIYVTRVSEVANIRKEIILAEVENTATRSRGVRDRPVGAPGSDGSLPAVAEPRSQSSRPGGQRRSRVEHEAHERAILAVLLQSPAKFDWIAERVGEDEFWLDAHRRIYRAILDAAGEVSVEEIERALPAEDISALKAVIEYGPAIQDINRTLDDSLSKLASRELERQRDDLQRQMSVASPEEQDALLREKSRRRDEGGSWMALKTGTTMKRREK